MKPSLAVHTTEQPDAPAGREGSPTRARPAEGLSPDFRSLLGRAVARASRAHGSGSPDSAGDPTSGEGDASFELLGGALAPPGSAASQDTAAGAGIVQAAQDAQVQPGSAPEEGAAGSTEPPAGSSSRPAARKRRPAGPPESETARALSPAGDSSQAPATAAAHASAATAPRAAKPALAREGATRLATANAIKQPLAAPSQAKPALVAGRDREKPREREALRPGEPGAAARSEPPDTQALAPEGRTAARPAAPQTTLRPALPIPPPPPGQEVQGAVLRHAAHLKIDAGVLGAVELHLRVREGALYLRVDGEGARAVEARAGELSRALAGEGLRLAPIEVQARDGAGSQVGAGEGGRQGDERRQAWNEASDARQAAPARARSAQPEGAGLGPAQVELGRAGSVHVKA